MKTYINTEEKYKDVKSTGWSFTVVGVIGLILVALLWFDVVSINMATPTKLMVSLVMGVMFFIFIAIGVYSFLSLKRVVEEGELLNSKMQEIKDWFMTEYYDQAIVQFDDSTEEDKHELYFQRYNFIYNTIKDYHNELNDGIIDHLTEEICKNIFNEN